MESSRNTFIFFFLINSSFVSISFGNPEEDVNFNLGKNYLQQFFKRIKYFHLFIYFFYFQVRVKQFTPWTNLRNWRLHLTVMDFLVSTFIKAKLLRQEKYDDEKNSLNSLHGQNGPAYLLPANKRDDSCRKSYLLEIIWLQPQKIFSEGII